MSKNFEELDYQQTVIGELILRRRRFPVLGELDVFEVILNDEFLMSSLYTAGEIALTELGLDEVTGDTLDVIVGGLGLGYTAARALEDPRIKHLTVIEALPNVIDWHERGLLPLSDRIAKDPRSSLHLGNFFALARESFTEVNEAQKYHAVLLDIDHSPAHVLHPDNEIFYSEDGLNRLSECLHDDGVFALWSNDPPEHDFYRILESVFTTSDAHIIDIENPVTGELGQNTIYVAS